MNFILIEDHNLVRQGVSKIIEEKSDFSCSGTFASIEDAKKFLADYCRTPDYQSLICIVDINLGGMSDDEDGLSLIRFIKEKYTRLSCICYSMFKGAGIVEQAVAAGAVAYVSKNADLEVLLQAMEKASKGDGSFFMEESLTSDYVIYTNLYHSLTKRERELTGLFFQHKSDEEIAQSMGITVRAVCNYMTRILSKLGVVSKKELMTKFGDMSGGGYKCIVDIYSRLASLMKKFTRNRLTFSHYKKSLLVYYLKNGKPKKLLHYCFFNGFLLNTGRPAALHRRKE